MSSIRNNEGTTIIEVLVAMILIAVTALGGIALFFNANQLQSIVLHKKMAIELANSQMEECRRAGCAAGTSDVTISGLTIPNGLTIQDNTSIWTGYDTKVVNISWNEAGPTSRDFSVNFTTLVPQ